MRHMWKDCHKRRAVCQVCHKDYHTTNEYGYVDPIIEYEPESQAAPVVTGTLSAHNLRQADE